MAFALALLPSQTTALQLLNNPSELSCSTASFCCPFSRLTETQAFGQILHLETLFFLQIHKQNISKV
jgi:hypothetical protein